MASTDVVRLRCTPALDAHIWCEDPDRQVQTASGIGPLRVWIDWGMPRYFRTLCAFLERLSGPLRLADADPLTGGIDSARPWNRCSQAHPGSAAGVLFRFGCQRGHAHSH